MKYFLIVFFSIALFAKVKAQTENPNKANGNTIYNNSAPANIPATIPAEEKEEESEKDSKKKVEEKKGGKVENQPQKSTAPSTKSKDVETSTTKSQETLKQTSYSIDYNITHQRTSRSASPAHQSALDDNVEDLKKNYPESFEYHYFAYASTKYDTAAYYHLKAAEKLKPDNADLQINLLANSIITKNVQDQKMYANKLVQSGRISKDILSYDLDMLMSVPQSGVLITHCNEDTYGAIYQQKLNAFRPDVQIISLELMQSKVYRKIWSDKGFLLPAGEEIDTKYLQEFCRLNKNKDLFLSLTIPKEYLQAIKSNIYISGLTFQYSQTPIENVQTNIAIWEFDLTKTLITEAQSEKGRELLANYLPMLLVLRSYYEATDKSKLTEIDDAINAVASASNKYQQIQKIKKSY